MALGINEMDFIFRRQRIKNHFSNEMEKDQNVEEEREEKNAITVINYNLCLIKL